MRVGKSPNKNRTTAYRPARVTVCVLTSIPDQTGYYAHRLDVVKVCFASILKQTVKGSYDLLVFDNGSCPAAVDYLRSLRDQGDLQYLLLSTDNIGKVNAYRMMFEAAPGEIVAYTDDDVLFYQGWLPEQLAVLETFPKVGMVSGVPVRHQFRYGNQYLPAYLAESPDIDVRRGRLIPDEWEQEFLVGTGRSREPASQFAQIDDILLTCRGTSAYSTATHFQFIARKKIILQALPADFEARLMRQPVRAVDERLDALGYARLSTTGRFVRHMGNVISGDLAAEVDGLGLSDSIRVWAPPGRLARLVASTERLAQRIRNWHYFATRSSK